MARRILVTGGAGFIGSHLTDTLIGRGEQVVVFDNFSSGKRAFVHPQAVLVEGDVRDEADVARAFEGGIDAVCHIAGQASIRLSYADPSADLLVNTLGTVNVLAACVRQGVPRLLFASSMTIYGNPRAVPTPESMPPDPVSYYGVTKYAAERYVHLTPERVDLGFMLAVTSFRMFNVYGPRQSLSNPYQGVLAIFLGNVLRGEPITLHGDGEQSRDFVFVSDVARAWADALDAPRTHGQVINLGTGHPTSVNRLCDLVLENFGHSRENYPIKRQSAQPGDIRASSADITRAGALLGWTPQIDIAAGMKETIAWARSE